MPNGLDADKIRFHHSSGKWTNWLLGTNYSLLLIDAELCWDDLESNDLNALDYTNLRCGISIML